MKELHLSIVSPEKSIFDGDVKIVTLPGMIGSFSILPGHAPIVSSLKAGTLSYTTMEGEEHTMDIQGGFVEMSNGNVFLPAFLPCFFAIGASGTGHGSVWTLCWPPES